MATQVENILLEEEWIKIIKICIIKSLVMLFVGIFIGFSNESFQKNARIPQVYISLELKLQVSSRSSKRDQKFLFLNHIFILIFNHKVCMNECNYLSREILPKLSTLSSCGHITVLKGG